MQIIKNGSKKLKGLILILGLIFLTGCTKDLEKNLELAMNKMGSFSSVTSKYQPYTRSHASFDKYIDLVSKVNGETVSDKKGEYYHKLKNDYLYRVQLNKDDGDSLRNSIKKGKGLLVPFFRYSTNKNGPLIVVDWKKTKYMHTFLSNKMNLKLATLSDTKKFYKTVKNLSNTYGYTEYNINTDKNILKEANLNPDYLITNGAFEPFYNHNRLFDRGFNANDQLSWYYQTIEIITRSNSIQFKPSSLINNSKIGKVYFYSSCYSMKNSLFRKSLNIGKKTNILIMKKLYLDTVKKSNDNFYTFINECRNGYNKLKITGSLSNDDL